MTWPKLAGDMISLGGPPTGPVADPATLANVAAGHVGSVLNLVGRDRIATAQTLARSTRLGIPLVFSLDVVHGYRTIFPVPIGEAAAFDPALWQETAQAAAAEARREGIHLTFAPMLDIARDPRWGRIVEGAGRIGGGSPRQVDGFQGARPRRCRDAAATASFVAYGAAIAGRDYASAAVSEKQPRRVYLPPFARPSKPELAAIMPLLGYRRHPDDRPCALIAGRCGDWGFDGVVISDWDAISQLVAHGVAADLARPPPRECRGRYRRGRQRLSARPARSPGAWSGRTRDDRRGGAARAGWEGRLGLLRQAGPAARPANGLDRCAGRRALAGMPPNAAPCMHDDPASCPSAARGIAVIRRSGATGAAAPAGSAHGQGLGEPDRAPSLPTALRPLSRQSSKAGVDARRPGRHGMAGAVAAARAAILLLCLTAGRLERRAASRAEPGRPAIRPSPRPSSSVSRPS
jgi:beta-glucosidase